MSHTFTENSQSDYMIFKFVLFFRFLLCVYIINCICDTIDTEKKIIFDKLQMLFEDHWIIFPFMFLIDLLCLITITITGWQLGMFLTSPTCSIYPYNCVTINELIENSLIDNTFILFVCFCFSILVKNYLRLKSL